MQKLSIILVISAMIAGIVFFVVIPTYERIEDSGIFTWGEIHKKKFHKKVDNWNPMLNKVDTMKIKKNSKINYQTLDVMIGN